MKRFTLQGFQLFIVSLIILAFILGLIINGYSLGKKQGEKNVREQYNDAIELWETIENVCDLSESTPVMKMVVLPNGNIGYTISCEKAKSI